MVYYLLSVFFCFSLFVLVFNHVTNKSFVKKPEVKEKKFKEEDENDSNLYELLNKGYVSSFASFNDVQILKNAGLFYSLPVIRLNSPSRTQLEKCIKLMLEKNFTIYAFDCFDKTLAHPAIKYINSNEISPKIFFAINRLRLNKQVDESNYSVLSKTMYKTEVRQGVKYVVDAKSVNYGPLAIEQTLPKDYNTLYIEKCQGSNRYLENLYDGSKLIVVSNKKIIIKYDINNKKIIFIFSKNQLNDDLFIFISNKNSLNNENLSYVKSFSTTDLKLNKQLNLALACCNEFYYTKFNFIKPFEQISPEINIQQFILLLRAGKMSLESAKTFILNNFMGVKINGDTLSFIKPKFELDFLLNISHGEKSFLITRKCSLSNVCQVSVDGVCYRNFTTFSFVDINSSEIFLEY